MTYWDDRNCSWDEWVVEPRFVEYAGFQLALGIYHSALVWEIVESRRSADRQDWDAHVRRLRRIFGVHRYFATHHKGLPGRVHIELTARKLQLTAREVYIALEEAKLFGIPELVAATAEPNTVA